jgi:integrase/recombinase XerD
MEGPPGRRDSGERSWEEGDMGSSQDSAEPSEVDREAQDPASPVELPGRSDRSHDVDQLMDRFLAHVRRAGAASSANTYGTQLRSLRRHLDELGVTRIQQLREEHLEGWQDALQARGLSRASRALAATTLRSWLNWLMERELVGWRLLRAVTTVKRPRARARPVPAGDLARLRHHLEEPRRGRSVIELRDRALFFYLLTTGARIGEALQLRREGYADVLVVQKGGREKRMRIPQEVVAIVEEYLAARSDPLPQLWVTHPTGQPCRPLTREAANHVWERLARQLGLKSWTNHRLRDSAATHLALRRVPTHMIADFLGHADLRTVMKYIQIADEQRDEIVEVMGELFDREARPPLRKGVRIRGSRPDARKGRER